MRFWYGTNRAVNYLCKGNGTAMQGATCPLNASVTQTHTSSQFTTVFWNSEKFWAQLKYTDSIKVLEKSVMPGDNRSVRTSSLPLCRSGTTLTKESFIPLSASTLNTKESCQGIKGHHVSHYFLLKPLRCSETVMRVIWVYFRK